MGPKLRREDSPLPRFDLWGVPAVGAASVGLIVVSLVLFSLPTVGYVEFSEPDFETRNLTYEIQDTPNATTYTLNVTLASQGSFSQNREVYLSFLFVDVKPRPTVGNITVDFEAQLTSQDASGSISLLQVFRVDRTLWVNLNEERNGSLTFLSPGEKNVTAEYVVTVENTTLSGLESQKVQVTEAPQPTEKLISFYGAAFALLTIGLALPGSSASLRNLWVNHRIQRASASPTAFKWRVRALLIIVIVLIIILLLSLGSLFQLSLLYGIIGLISLIFLILFAISFRVLLLLGKGQE